MTQAERRSHAERTDLSDRRMLDAAIRLIVERGTDKTTLKEVGVMAGYSRGLAGYRFGSKAGLFESIVRSVGERWLADMTRVTAGKTGLDAIDAALDEHCRFCLEASDPVRAFYTLWFESVGLRSPVGEIIAGIQRRRHLDVVAWIEQTGYRGAMAPDALADQFISTVLGIAYQWLSNPGDAYTVRRLHQGLKDTMRHLLVTDPS